MVWQSESGWLHQTTTGLSVRASRREPGDMQACSEGGGDPSDASGGEKKNHDKKKIGKGNRVGCKAAILILWYFAKWTISFFYLFFLDSKVDEVVVLHSHVEMWQHNKCR